MLTKSYNPYLFTSGGTIRGDYRFKNADLEITSNSSIILDKLSKIE